MKLLDLLEDAGLEGKVVVFAWEYGGTEAYEVIRHEPQDDLRAEAADHLGDDVTAMYASELYPGCLCIEVAR